jgi:hypothetical protein
MDLGNGLGHLTYSTLVHPGDTWEEMWASLTTYVPQVKARVCPDDRVAPFGNSTLQAGSQDFVPSVGVVSVDGTVPTADAGSRQNCG